MDRSATRNFRLNVLIFALLAALGVMAYAPPAEAVNSVQDMERDQKILEEYYIYETPDGLPRVDLGAADAAGEPDRILIAGETFNTYLDESYAQESGVSARAVSFPVYGRWCGPGHSGPGAPIDLLDRMCKNHDECYARKGYFDCGCDRGLIAAMRDNYSRLSTKAKAVSVGITAAISASMTVHRC